MGNKVGFEIEQGSVKIAVFCQHQRDVEFMDELKSSNMKHRAQMKQSAGVTYFFRYTIDQFLQVALLVIQLKLSDNILKLRKHYITQLDKPNIDIYVNRETSRLIEDTLVLRQTIRDLLQVNFTPKYRQNYASSVQSLNCLNYFAQESQYFKFTTTITPNQLHLVTKGYECKKVYHTLPDYPYLLGSLNKGALFFKVNAPNKVDNVAGSIIGQLTICSLLEKIAKCKEQNLEEVINQSFEEGDNRNADLLLEDVYGVNPQALGAHGGIIACSLGKVCNQQQCKLQDKCKSLLLAFAINIAQFMCMQMRILNIKHCILLANKLHNDYFYYIIQSIAAFNKSEVLFANLSNFMSCMSNIQFTP